MTGSDLASDPTRLMQSSADNRFEPYAQAESPTLSVRDVVRAIARQTPLFSGLTLLVLGMTLYFHWAFPPWYQANVYLKLGEEWGRAVQTEQQTLQESFAVNRTVLVERLMREGNVGPKPRPLDPEEGGPLPPLDSEAPPLVEWDLKTANLIRCELPPMDPRRIVLFGQGRTPDLAVAFLENTADRIVSEHLAISGRFRKRWTDAAELAQEELTRLQATRKTIQEMQIAGEREQTLQQIALDMLDRVEVHQHEDLDKARERLELSADSMTSRTGTPQILGPVGARTWPIVCSVGLLAGALAGSLGALTAEVWRLWRLQRVTNRSPQA